MSYILYDCHVHETIQRLGVGTLHATASEIDVFTLSRVKRSTRLLSGSIITRLETQEVGQNQHKQRADISVIRSNGCYITITGMNEIAA